MGAVPLGASGIDSAGIHPANNVNFSRLGSSVAKTSMLGIARKALSFGGRALLRLNPYVAGAMMLYDGYELYKAYSDSSPSSDASSGAGVVPISASSDNSTTKSSFNVPTTGLVLPDVASANNSKNLMFLNNVATSSATINNDVQRTLSVPPATDGRNLLDVLIQNNEKTNKILASLVQSVNNFSVTSSVNSSSISHALNFLGATLATQVQQDALYYKLADSKQYVNDLQTHPDIDNSLQNDLNGWSDSLDSVDTSDYANGFVNNGHLKVIPDDFIFGRSMNHTLYTYAVPTHSRVPIQSDDSDNYNSPAGMDDLVSAINPASREEFYQKNNLVSDYKLTPKPAVDLDGNVITDSKVSPLDVEHINNSATARKHTDENNFELEDEDFDLWNLPNMDFLQDVDYSQVYKAGADYDKSN